MGKYLVLYHAPPSAMKNMGKMTSKQKKEGMAMWMAWAKRCGKKLIDLGAPIGKSAKVDRKSSGRSTKNVCGYSIISAKDMTEAKKLIKNHPHLMWKASASIELHPMMPLPK